MTNPLDLSKYQITARFNDYNLGLWPLTGGYHRALDIAAPKGTPIHAIKTGKVIYSGTNDDGQGVKIIHDDGKVSVYWHTDTNFVKVGDIVEEGQEIATVGNTGQAKGYHLHFAIEDSSGVLYDPEIYLKQSEQPDNDFVTVQKGWGISYVAKAAGYEDFASESRWDYIARLNGYPSWHQLFLHPGDILKVRGEVAPPVDISEQVKNTMGAVQDKLKEAEDLKQAVITKQETLNNALNEVQAKITEVQTTINPNQGITINFPDAVITPEIESAGNKYLNNLLDTIGVYWNKVPNTISYPLTIIWAAYSPAIISFLTGYQPQSVTFTLPFTNLVVTLGQVLVATVLSITIIIARNLTGRAKNKLLEDNK
jgi:hypothetical protein